MHQLKILEAAQSSWQPPPVNPIAPALGTWRVPFEHLPIGIFICDRDGILVQYNRRAAELWGRSPPVNDPGNRFSGAFKTFTSDGTPLSPNAFPAAEVLRTGAPVNDREIQVERPDGSRLCILSNAEPLQDEHGEWIGAITCFQDITKAKQTERAARDREQWFRELLEALPAAIYTTDTDGRITFFNQTAAELAGRTPELGSSGCVTWKLLDSEGAPLAQDECPMALAIRSGTPIRGVEAIAERPDGSRVPILPFPTPLHDSAGALAGGVNMLLDISERKRAEERHRTLIAEINHRVKNTLAIVQSLAIQTMRGEGVAREFREAFGARLLALSRVHDELTRAEWESADLRNVLSDILSSYGKDRVLLEGEPVALPPKAAVTLAMVFHELASNAAKYGALSVMAGRLIVHWSVRREAGSRSLEIVWSERGGPEVAQTVIKGFGSRLVERGIAGQLQGTAFLEFDPKGVRCRMSIPLPP